MEQHYEPVPLPDFQEFPEDEMRAQAREYYENIKKRHSVRHFYSTSSAQRKKFFKGLQKFTSGPVVLQGYSDFRFPANLQVCRDVLEFTVLLTKNARATQQDFSGVSQNCFAALNF